MNIILKTQFMKNNLFSLFSFFSFLFSLFFFLPLSFFPSFFLFFPSLYLSSTTARHECYLISLSLSIIPSLMADARKQGLHGGGAVGHGSGAVQRQKSNGAARGAADGQRRWEAMRATRGGAPGCGGRWQWQLSSSSACEASRPLSEHPSRIDYFRLVYLIPVASGSSQMPMMYGATAHFA
jgi:hypothetical protein